MRRPRFPIILALALLVALAWAPARGIGEHSGGGAFGPRLKGQFLVATPRMAAPRFRKTVVFMVDHNANGAMGLIVNRVYGRGPLSDLMEGLGFRAGGRGFRGVA